MIRDVEAWRRWEAQWQRRTPVDLETNWRAFQAMIDHARALKIWPPANPMGGIEVVLRVAKAVNTYVPPPDRTASSRT